jgi:FkbM family methyltransferase
MRRRGSPAAQGRELPVCVLGMARSGTSLTARVLNLLGVDLGPEEGLIPANVLNAKGFWERRVIYEINEAVLAAMGGDYAHPPPLERGWERSAQLEPLKQRARKVLEECFGGSPLWGFKDARTSLTLPFWRELVPQMRCVICMRNPDEVFASLVRYPSDGFEDRNWLDLWLRSTISAIVETEDNPLLLVFYEDYFADLRAQVELLAEFIDRPVTQAAFSAIESFVERDLRHHWLDFEDVDPDGHRPPEARSLYQALRGLPPRPAGWDIMRVVDLYTQEPEARLLGAFLSRLDRRSVIDVGAERGAFAEAFLSAGADEIYAIEPEPGNVAFMRKRFRDDARVRVLEYAISSADEQLGLHKSVDPSGAPVTFGHTVLERPDTDEIAWRETIPVTGRSLASLVAAGELPGQVGILKVDTEGHDLAVIEGMGELECDVVMVEHWTDLPHSLGPCPWTAEEMRSALRKRGFSHFAFIEHRGEHTILKWDDPEVPSGEMGNLVFLHDRVLELLLPSVVEAASMLTEQPIEKLALIEQDRRARMAVIERLDAALKESEADRQARLELIEQLDAALKESEADRQARLEAIEQLDTALEESEADRQARLEAIEQLDTALKESEADRQARLEAFEQLDEALRGARPIVRRSWVLERLEAALEESPGPQRGGN